MPGPAPVRVFATPPAAEVVDERTRVIRAMTGNGAQTPGPRPVLATMPGLVVRVEVAEGDTVRGGQGIVIVEAMKMENELRAEGPGVVRRVHVLDAAGRMQVRERDDLRFGPAGADVEDRADTLLAALRDVLGDAGVVVGALWPEDDLLLHAYAEPSAGVRARVEEWASRERLALEVADEPGWDSVAALV